MADYGIHECMYMDEDVTIDRTSGNWWINIPIVIEGKEDTQIEERMIKFCPFCGEELK